MTQQNQAVSYGNPLQTAAITALIAAFAATRQMAVKIAVIAANTVNTVSGYVIAGTSIVFNVTDEQGNLLPDFPAIECKRTGKFALPTIRSYKEANVPNTLQAYPNGATAFDAALFADSHVRKQNGAWLRRSPQAATSALVGAQVQAPATSAVTIPAEPVKPAAKPESAAKK